ncbi:hypothetical protein C8A03DRAFT_43759 [Achaetomium macrosporum]|uniref:C2H2-type domain-containing protein n=1 Tax=Achaetomium macrosporum TaxID=79813 RepID=A0AAN7CAR2_9PEZI|nr:hypothetical protein C8A03DRAFT_43759 [Achaetomium macrosporum]
MGLITVILRGFKVPISVLNRFLASNGVEEIDGTPPRLFYLPGEPPTVLDPQSACLRAKLVPAGDTDSRARLFIPQPQGQSRSTYGYVAYAYTQVYIERMIDSARELPDQAPPGFAELRREILGFAEEGEEPLLLLFSVITDDREFPLEGTFMRQSYLRCDDCAAVFDYWFDFLYHRRDAHGVELSRNPLC